MAAIVSRTAVGWCAKSSITAMPAASPRSSWRRFTPLKPAIAAADEVLLAGVFKADALKDEERMRPEVVVERVRAAGKSARYLPEVDEIVEHLARHRTGKDVALIMSNGGFGNIWERLLARLRQS